MGPMGMQRRIALVLVCFAISFLNPTFSSQVDEISNSNSFLCISDQYIIQSYFTTHTCLDSDSEFQNFLFLHKCPQKDPNILLPVTSLLQRNITGEGSHRNLITSIKLLVQESEFQQLVIVERLPLGVFADPFELQSLQRPRGFGDVSVFGDTNLELPSFKSNRSVVEIHVNINTRDYENGEITVKLPLHARYQPLEESGYSSVEFGEPDLFLCSSYVQDRQHEQRRCMVLSVGGLNTEMRPVVWEIPAGIRAHTEYVSAITFAAAVLSAFSILVASVLSSKVEYCKDIKQS